MNEWSWSAAGWAQHEAAAAYPRSLGASRTAALDKQCRTSACCDSGICIAAVSACDVHQALPNKHCCYPTSTTTTIREIALLWLTVIAFHIHSTSSDCKCIVYTSKLAFNHCRWLSFSRSLLVLCNYNMTPLHRTVFYVNATTSDHV